MCVVHTLVNKMDLGPFLSSYSCQSIREKTAECCDKGSFGMGERFFKIYLNMVLKGLL